MISEYNNKIMRANLLAALMLVVATFGANFGNLWAVFILSSGHTDYKLATFSTGKMLR